jgi:hypothetical protein
MAADRLFVNATFHTLDARNSVVHALAVKGDRIVAGGSLDAMRARFGRTARQLDLGGRVVLPGIVDAHSHLTMVGEHALYSADVNSPPIGEVQTIDDIIDVLREHAGRPECGAWIQGHGYDDTLLDEGRHPTSADLDLVARDRPVVITHISGHFLAANSIALAQAGIDRATEDPVGGVIRRNPDGSPDGVLEESAMLPVLRLLPRRSEDERVRAIEHGAREYLRLGITTAQDGNASLTNLADYDAAWAAGRLPIRVVPWPSFRGLRALLEGQHAPLAPPTFVKRGAIKLFADGSIQGYTGHLCCPYHMPFHGDADYRGYAAMPQADLDARVATVLEHGLQVAVHANGDAAIDAFLDAVAKAKDRGIALAAPPIVVHAQMARDDQLDRMLELGVEPSFFVLHTYYWGDRHRDRFLGPDRARRISPAKSALERGLRFTLHTDSPVTPMDPWLLLWSAVNRRTTSGEALGPEQRLSPLQALRATTIDAAIQLGVGDDRGSLEAGKLADFIVVDRDPLAVERDALRDIRVLATYVGGTPVVS